MSCPTTSCGASTARCQRPAGIGIFDRSHYEDVLPVRVHNPCARGGVVAAIRADQPVRARGHRGRHHDHQTVLVVSKDEQKQRLTDWLNNPAKYWKYNPADIDERAYWDASPTEAHQAILDKTDTDVAPWFIVGADRKWFTAGRV